MDSLGTVKKGRNMKVLQFLYEHGLIFYLMHSEFDLLFCTCSQMKAN